MFLTLIEHARTLWLREVMGCEATIWDHATVHVCIDYRAEMLVEHGEVTCSFNVVKVGNSSIELRERMEAPSDRVVAELETVIVAWLPQLHRTRPITPAERASLAALH